MKKRSLSLLSLTLMALLLCSLPAAASQFRGSNAGSGDCLYLIDTDGDGVVDSRPTPGTGLGANAANFVDADNDGICDTYAAGGDQLLLQDGSGALNAPRSMRRAGGTR
ncbi:MAG: hypothetical protein JXR59_03690 [Desulfuromonadaceae bacterium]|nr:hypothetical protein [Desulfuromonadaceae bacterium]